MEAEVKRSWMSEMADRMAPRTHTIVWRRFTLSASHCLPGHPKCGQMHGHNYVIELGIEGPVIDGMVVDFGSLKDIFVAVIEKRYDHTNLNQFEELKMPTAENMAAAIAGLLREPMQALRPARLAMVRIYETENCWVEYVLQ